MTGGNLREVPQRMGWSRAISTGSLAVVLLGAGGLLGGGGLGDRRPTPPVPVPAAPAPASSAPAPTGALVEADQRRPAPLRAIAGFSMGGYGAAAIALRHPDEYRQVASFSGYYRTDDPDGIFGRQPGAHAPDRLLDAAGGQRYFLVEGPDEPTPPRVAGIPGQADPFAPALRGRPAP